MIYKSPPKGRLSGRVPLTTEMIAKLREETERTATRSVRLLNGAKDKPAGLRASMIDSWVNGHVESVKPEHYAYVLARWMALPTGRRMPLTSEMSAALNAELTRTGLGPVTALKRAGDCPPGLTYQVVTAWASGTINSVAVAEWEYLFDRLKRLPDAAMPTTSGLLRREAAREISESDLAELRAQRERTGLGGGKLLSLAPDRPKELTPAMIAGWLSGQTKSVRPDHFAFVMDRYRASPGTCGPKTK